MENPTLAITVCHHSASLVMPIGDPRDGFFYPTPTLMMDSYYPLLVLLWDQKSQPITRIIRQKRGFAEFLMKVFGSEGGISLSHNNTSSWILFLAHLIF